MNHMKILLGDFNAKVGRENIFQPTIGTESVHLKSNDNGIRLVNLLNVNQSTSHEGSEVYTAEPDIREPSLIEV